MAQTKNAVMEINNDGTATVIDMTGCVRVVPDVSYEAGQIVYLDVEAIDLAAAAESDESADRAMAGDFDAKVISFPSRTKRALARRAFPIAASFALVLIFGIGGSVYATGEVAETVEVEGVSYDLNYFNRVIGVHADDMDDEELFDMKRDMRGKRLEEAVDIAKDRMPISDDEDTAPTPDETSETPAEIDAGVAKPAEDHTSDTETKPAKPADDGGQSLDKAPQTDAAPAGDIKPPADTDKAGGDITPPSDSQKPAENIAPSADEKNRDEKNPAADSTKPDDSVKQNGDTDMTKPDAGSGDIQPPDATQPPDAGEGAPNENRDNPPFGSTDK